MANAQASVKTCRSPAAVADQTLIRASTTAHDASLATGQVRHLRPVGSRPLGSVPARSPGTGGARGARGGARDRRRVERDLHDGVQSELVALIVKLAVAQQDPETPPALTRTLVAIEAHAQAALDSVRNIARGMYPPVLADFGLAEALRVQAARAAVNMRLVGTAPRDTEDAEEAVYFADDGQGFDPDQATEGAGLQNIRDRIEDLGGSFELAAKPGCGTVLTLALPWPTRADPDR